MNTAILPKYVKRILIKLEMSGHSAFLVGGCVRDMLLSKRPNDWDICTDALPEEILKIFPRAFPSGIKHGTITVNIENKSLEVTTFRTEGDYSDHRHPDAVSFVTDLREDLIRRDFTINAIALSASGYLADPFGGVEDIKEKTIRSIGDGEKRFTEDALRMFRALRFSAKLGFEIDAETSKAIHKCSHLHTYISQERKRDEIEKIIISRRPQVFGDLLSYGLLDDLLITPRSTAGFWRLSKTPVNKAARWAAACALMEKNALIASSHEFLSGLRLDSRTVNSCSRGVSSAINNECPKDKLAWKKYLSLYGVPASVCCAAAADALYPGGSSKELRGVLKSGDCFSRERLAVSGDDLMGLGYRGSEIGNVLEMLLNHVISVPKDNKKEKLLEILKNQSSQW